MDDPLSQARQRLSDAEDALRMGRPDRGDDAAGGAVAEVRASLEWPSVPPAASERLEAACVRPGPIDHELLALVEDVTAGLSGAYYSTPPAALLPSARAHLDRVVRLSSAASSPCASRWRGVVTRAGGRRC